MNLKVINDYPPNYEEIKTFIDPPFNAVFAFYPYIYNPSRIKIYPDIFLHEETHFIQQDQNPEGWWNLYLQDKEFRQRQEIEAFSAQYRFLKGVMTNKDLKLALYDMAKALTQDYGLELSHIEAENKIRMFSLS